ncbi:MAG: oligosaccharide flippase family protein [Arcicella sp.]|nr:oligosaccharide flippase family protein [Arcicella sp.]
MGIVIRQSIKSTFVTYIGVVIGTVNVLFLYNKFLSTEQFGLYTTLVSYPIIFSVFAGLSAPHISIQFFNKFADDDKKHNGFFAFLISLTVVGFVIFIGLYTLFRPTFVAIYSEHSPLLIQYFWIFAIITFFLTIQITLEAYCRIHLRVVVPTIIREIFQKGSNSILAILLGFQYITFNQLVWGIVVSYALSVIFLFIYIKILGRLYLNFDFSFLRRPIAKEIYRYGLWLLLGGTSATILPHIEKLMLPSYKGGLEQNAIFNIALSIGLVIAIPRNAISSISSPILAESWGQNDFKNIANIYVKSAINLLIIGVFLFLGIWCNIDAIFQIIPNAHIYRSGKLVVLLVGIYSVIDMATGLNSEILRNSPYFKNDLYFNFLRLILLGVSNYFLIEMYSYNGAAFAMLISVIVYNLVKFFFIKYKMGLQPFGFGTIKVIVLGLLTYGITLLIPVFEGNIWITFLNITLKSFCILLCFGGGVLLLGVSEDLNRVVKKVWGFGFDYQRRGGSKPPRR